MFSLKPTDICWGDMMGFSKQKKDCSSATTGQAWTPTSPNTSSTATGVRYGKRTENQNQFWSLLYLNQQNLTRGFMQISSAHFVRQGTRKSSYFASQMHSPSTLSWWPFPTKKLLQWPKVSSKSGSAGLVSPSKLSQTKVLNSVHRLPKISLS